jgi:predicted MFS family arabinose efflux permease
MAGARLSRSGRPLDRLAWVHAASTCGDALVAVALAGTLFFAVPVAAARPRVALYLLLTVAPFAVVAPLLGRLLDGRSGAGRLALAAAMALRAALAALTVARTQSLLLYPLAFGLLVCSRAHGISRTAMVPEVLGQGPGPSPGTSGAGSGSSDSGPGPGEVRDGAAGGGMPAGHRPPGRGTRGSGTSGSGTPRGSVPAGGVPGRGAPRTTGPAGQDLVAVNGRMARVAALGGTAGALLGVALDRLLGGGAVLWAAAITFTVGTALALSLPTTRPRRDGVPGRDRDPTGRPLDPATGRPLDPAYGRPNVDPGRLPDAAPDRRRDPLDRRAARLARPPGRVRLARTANTCVRAVGGFTLFLLAFELRRQGVGTAGLGLLLAAVGAGGVVGAFLLPRAARLVREDGLLAGGLLLCGTTAWLLAGRVGVESAAAGGLAMGAGIAAARLGFESLVQREVPPLARGTAITRAETTFQLAWVAGAVLPVAFPLPTTPSLLAAALLCLVAATTYTVGLLRHRRSREARLRAAKPTGADRTR